MCNIRKINWYKYKVLDIQSGYFKEKLEYLIGKEILADIEPPGFQNSNTWHRMFYKYGNTHSCFIAKVEPI